MSSHPLDHVAVAVTSLEEAASIFERITGTACSTPETLHEQGVRVAFVGSLELLEPTDPETPVGRFLERSGPGLHHIAYRVPELEAALERLAGEGYELVDSEPRSGARGHRVAFLHPRSTGGVLIELVEEAG